MKNYLILLLALFVNNQCIFAFSGTGSGVKSNPYQIRNVQQLQEMNEELTAYYILMNDIDAAETENWNPGDHDNNSQSPDSAMGFEPIGDKSMPFSGSFDGNNHTINKLHINRVKESYVGLFSYADEYSKIKNIIINNCYIAGMNYVGSIVGHNKGDVDMSRVENSHISGSDYVGGLIGRNDSKIIGSYADAEVRANNLIGGLVGLNDGIIILSHSSGAVYGGNQVGGLSGKNAESIHMSYSIASVEGKEKVGGLAGYNYRGVICNSYAVGNVKAVSYIGGLVGSLEESEIISSYSICKISGSSNAGGLVGKKESGLARGSFWDIEESGISVSDGGDGLETKDMQNIETYLEEGWNFYFIWAFDNGYPFIKIDSSYRPQDTDNDGLINISTLLDLRWLSESRLDYDKDFELDNDIDASEIRKWNCGCGFVPIGSSNDPFNGDFDGNFHVINNIDIDRSYGGPLGFFGVISDSGQVMNLGIKDADIHYNYCSGVGTLAGVNDGSILNCFTGGGTKGEHYIGGLVGLNNGNIDMSFSDAGADGMAYMGGLAGSNSGDINNCYATDIAGGYEKAGGLAGSNSGSITNCYSIAERTTVQGDDGGLVGDIYTPGGDGYTKSCFYLLDDRGQKSKGGLGLPEEKMKFKSTYIDAGWDFDSIWAINPDINDGYPFFQWFATNYVGIDNKERHQNIKLFPNPTEDNIIINMPNAIIYKIELYDLSGRIAREINNIPSDNYLRIDVSDMQTGFYYIRLYLSDRVISEKILIQ